MKKNSLVLSILLMLSINSYATVNYIDCGGTQYKIKEKNIALLIKQYVEKNKKKIQKKINKQFSIIKKKIKTNYKPRNLSIKITPAKKDEIYYPDPSYTLNMDIKDANGKVIYPKGYTFNPLHYMTLHSQYIFFDYTNKEQVAWIKKNKYDKDMTKKLILVNGNVFQARKEFGINIFYASDILLKRFDITHSPSIVSQIGDRIEIKTFYLQKGDIKNEK